MMEAKHPKVVVGTLTWNQKEHVLECLRSLVALDYPNYEIVVVDNGSSDGTFEAVRRDFPSVRIVRHTENLGCAEGVNGEIRYALQAGADYLFIIANDATAEPQTLRELVRVAEKDPRIGSVFPKVYYFGGGKKIWFARGIKMREVDWLRGRFTGFVQNVDDDGRWDQEEEVHLYPGGFCLMRMEAVKKVGFLDPAYWIYYDDTDWLVRIHRAGYTGRYAPRARAWHKPASALGMETESFYYYRTRNRLFFYRKFSPAGQFYLFFVFFLAEFFLRTLPGLYRSDWKPQMQAALLGFVDFLRGKRGSRDFSKKGRGLFGRALEQMTRRYRDRERKVRFWVKRKFGGAIRIQVQLDWNIGDEIMAIPAYQVLKEMYPGCLVDAEVRYPELLRGNPFVDFVKGRPVGPPPVPVPSQREGTGTGTASAPPGLGGGASAVNEGKERKKFQPDLVMDFHGERRGMSRLEFLADRLGVTSLPLPEVYLDDEEVRDIARRFSITGSGLRIGMSTSSARWFARQWPKDKWIELAHSFTRQLGAEVFFLGKDDEPLGVGIDLIGKTTVREAACILSRCQLFVGSDSGLVHLALAVGTPTVGLFGPLDPGFLVAPRRGFIPIWSSVECRGCWSDGRMKYLDHCPKVLPDCMSSIPLSRVVQAADKLIAGRRLAPV